MREDNSEALGPLDGVWVVAFETGDAPLFEAVHWVATKGGSISFHSDLWPEAWAEIVFAWRKGDLKVYGRPIGRPALKHGSPEPISGDEIVGELRCVPPYPYGLPHDHKARRAIGDPTSGTGPCVEFWGRSDRVSWRDGFNDKLFVPATGCGWTHLTVSKEDIERRWPFGSTVDAQDETRELREGTYYQLLPREDGGKLRSQQRKAILETLWALNPSGKVDKATSSPSLTRQINAYIEFQRNQSCVVEPFDEIEKVDRSTVERFLDLLK